MSRITAISISILFSLIIAVTTSLITNLPAAACGGDWDVICNVGETLEKAGQDVERETSNTLDSIDPRITQFGRDIDSMRLELQSSVFTGPGLEQWFYASRNSAMNGAMPMPPDIQRALQGWYDPRLMNMVRFKVGDGGALNLANNSIRVGHANAVTLIDVIVFKGPSEAANPEIWAHEMKHVQQFDDWGVHSFAVQYMRSWNSVEDPAYAVQRQYAQNSGPRGYPQPVIRQQGHPSLPESYPAPVQQGHPSLPQSYPAPGYR